MLRERLDGDGFVVVENALDPSAIGARAPLWDVLGAAREQLGDPNNARRAYEAALAIDPTNTAARQGLARLAISG